MNLGMLWIDNNPKIDTAAKIRAAAAYYKNKYGAAPTICFVHPTMLPVTGETGLELKANKSILVNHFWLGREE